MTRFVSARSAALVAAAVALVSCQASAGKALPAGPPVVTVTMTEFSYAFDRPVPSGRVIFRMVNAGRLTHEPNLFPLSEDVPPIDQQVRGDARQVVAPYAGVLARQPGQVGTFAADLEAGQRYAFVCFARTPDNQSHAKLGMAAEFRPGQKGAAK